MIGYNEFTIYSSGFHKPNKNEVRFYYNKLKTLLINFSTENDLFTKIFIIIYEKVSQVFSTKNDYKSERLNTILVFKIKTEKIFVTLNLLPTVF
jgi:hypothetical protein